jgi:hypothetical protein
MANKQPLTKADLIAAFKEVGVLTRETLGADLQALGIATRTDVQDIVDEQLANFYDGRIKPELDEIRGEVSGLKGEFGTLQSEMRDGFKQVNTRLDRVGTDIHWLMDEVKGLKVEFAITPSRKELEELRREVKEIQIN